MHTELNTINSFIYDGINYSFVFKRNTPDFCLQAEKLEPNGRYIIRLTDLRLKGRYMIHFREAKKEDAEQLAHFAARTFWEAFRHQNTEPDMLAHQEIMYGPHIQLKEIQNQNIHTKCS